MKLLPILLLLMGCGGEPSVKAMLASGDCIHLGYFHGRNYYECQWHHSTCYISVGRGEDNDKLSCVGE